MDIKLVLIICGLAFVLWSCGGINAQEQPPSTIDTAGCYAEINNAVRSDWAALSPAQRALMGIKSIQICEAQP